MKKIFNVALVFIMIFSSTRLYAFDTSLKDIRDKIYEESTQIKELLPKTKDPVFISSMWDSCLIALTQLDAYFHMLKIFNAIKKEDLDEDIIKTLSDWLSAIKDMNRLNIESLTKRAGIKEAKTERRILKLKSLFSDLNSKIDAELKKVSIINASLRR